MTWHDQTNWQRRPDPAVTVGDSLPPLTFPVTYSTLAKDVAGTRDIYPIHHDPDFARANGAANIFLNTMWYQGLIGRYVNEWAGAESFIRKLAVTMKAHGCPGDVLTLRGTVTAVRRTGTGECLIDLDIVIDNQAVSRAVAASVTVESG